MKDSDTIVLKAFSIALYQQSALPEAQQAEIEAIVKAKLDEIGDNFDDRAIELHRFALNTPTLKIPYKQARQWLTSTSAERKMGLDNLAANVVDDDSAGEQENITFLAPSTLAEMEAACKTIETETNIPSLRQVLFDPHPIQAIKALLSRKS